MKQDFQPVVLTWGHSTRPLAVQIIRDTHYARQCRKTRPRLGMTNAEDRRPEQRPEGVEREETSLAKERWHCIWRVHVAQAQWLG